jgi:hypothetical protein
LFLDDTSAVTIGGTGSTIQVNGALELLPSESLTINGMQDITGAVTSGKLYLRGYGMGGTTDQIVVDYPIVDTSQYLRYSGTGTAASDLSDITSNTITFNTGLNDLLVYAEPKPVRSLGRTLHRQNHRGMQPRAVSVDFSTATPEEITALQLLRQLVGQDEFRRYLKYGFVMVQGASGLRYQIRRGRHVVDVWNERGRVDGICVYLTGNFPPTDDTITRMLMAERDELELWRRGNSRTGRKATVMDLARLYGERVAA